MAMSGAERQRNYRERQRALLAECEDPEEAAVLESHIRGGTKPPAPFIAIDGEAIGESGYHLLAASVVDVPPAENLEGLSSRDCIRWLLRLKKAHPRGLFIGFHLGYDCEWWIKDFGVKAFESLKERSEFDCVIDGRKLTIEYIPRKWFKIRRPWQKFGYLIEVFDVFSFFQAGFASVIGRPEYAERMEREFPCDKSRMPEWRKRLKGGWGVCTEDELVMIQQGKEQRGAFTQEGWEEVKVYNALECEILVRLANRLREALYACDIQLRHWYGPGAVANFLLKRYNMEEHIDKRPPPEVQDAIRRAYFGGRFQVFKLGHIEGVYDYDISSAYPYATSLLPSSNGRWEPLCAFDDTALWAVYEVSWSVDTPLTPFPWRDKHGNIHYPRAGRGWYWAWEVAAARRGWGDAIRVERGWRLHPAREGVFEWLTELAAKRVAAKQAAKMATGDERDRLTAIERAYKLALNSVYGKTIQTVGQKRPFLCPMWAGLITSHTRSRLIDGALTIPPEKLVCFATDGLFSTTPVSVVLGSDLGDWELAAENIRLELYQSGCYATYLDGELQDSRFRGISRADVPWDVLGEVWKRKGTGGVVTIPTKRFVGHRTALAHGKPHEQATWITMDKEIRLTPGIGFPVEDGWRAEEPGIYDYSECSAPYRKLPTGETDFELAEAEVQP